MVRGKLVLPVVLVGLLASPAAGRDDPGPAPQSAEEVVRLLLSGERRDRIRANMALRSDERGEEWVRELVRHADPVVRFAGVWGIRDERLPAFLGLLTPLLRDPADGVWTSAWERLLSVGPDAFGVLAEARPDLPRPEGVAGIVGPFPASSRHPGRFAWAPTGDVLATAGTDGVVTLWDPESASATARLEDPERAEAACLAWSGDGRSLAVGLRRSAPIRIWRCGGEGDWRVSRAAGMTAPDALAWWPAENAWVASVLGILVAYDGETGRCRSGGPYVPFRPGETGSLAVCPRGEELAFVTSREIRLFRSWGESEVFLDLRPLGPTGAAVAWSPDGKRLAVYGRSGSLSVREVEGGAVLWMRKAEHAFGPGGLAWSPDGSRFAEAAGERGIVLRDAGTGEVRSELPSAPYRIRRVSWSPDGRRLATDGLLGAVLLWDLPPAPRPTPEDGSASGYGE